MNSLLFLLHLLSYPLLEGPAVTPSADPGVAFPISIRGHWITSEGSTPALGKHNHAFMDIQMVHQCIVRHPGTTEPCSVCSWENWKLALSKNGSHGFASWVALEDESFAAATKCQSCVRDNEGREREGGKSLAQP